MTWNIPNALTILRFLLVPVFVIFILREDFSARLISLGIFVIAAITDFLDGKLARVYNQKSEFGKFADPLADKFLVAAALIAFVQLEETLIPFWLVLLILAREFIITGLRITALSQEHQFATSSLGKAKTTAQMFSITVILVLLILRSYVLEFPQAELIDWVNYEGSNPWIYLLKYAPLGLMSITAFLTLFSGIRYLLKNRTLWTGNSNTKTSVVVKDEKDKNDDSSLDSKTENKKTDGDAK